MKPQAFTSTQRANENRTIAMATSLQVHLSSLVQIAHLYKASSCCNLSTEEDLSFLSIPLSSIGIHGLPLKFPFSRLPSSRCCQCDAGTLPPETIAAALLIKCSPKEAKLSTRRRNSIPPIAKPPSIGRFPNRPLSQVQDLQDPHPLLQLCVHCRPCQRRAHPQNQLCKLWEGTSIISQLKGFY